MIKFCVSSGDDEEMLANEKYIGASFKHLSLPRYVVSNNTIILTWWVEDDWNFQAEKFFL